MMGIKKQNAEPSMALRLHITFVSFSEQACSQVFFLGASQPEVSLQPWAVLFWGEQ